MRRKLREIMDKEEGFTLVELLAVIVILAIIVAIAVPGIGKIISNSQNKADDAEVELVEDAARIYFTTNDDAVAEPTIQTLIDDHYLDIGNKNTRLIKTTKLTYDKDTGEITMDPTIIHESD